MRKPSMRSVSGVYAWKEITESPRSSDTAGFIVPFAQLAAFNVTFAFSLQNDGLDSVGAHKVEVYHENV